MSEARVGKEAPDFKSAAYVRGVGFKEIKLSDYRGNWLASASTRVISPSFDRPSWRQLPSCILNSRSSALMSFQ